LLEVYQRQKVVTDDEAIFTNFSTEFVEEEINHPELKRAVTE
jgi:hypothetical protein